MEQENEQQEVEQEIAPVEETTEEVESELETPTEELPEVEDDSISISKSELTKLKRKAIAYDSTKGQKTPPVKNIDDSERFERLELRADGYSNEEIHEIMELGGTKVLNSKIVQSAIKAMRAEAKSKDAAQSLHSKSPVYKKFTQEDLSKMSSKEMEKILS